MVVLLTAAFALLTGSLMVYGQDDLAASVEAARQAASAAKESAESAKLSTFAGIAVWLFAPFSFTIPVIIWWPLFILVAVLDGFYMSRTVYLLCSDDSNKVHDGLVPLFMFQVAIFLFGLGWLGVFNPVEYLIRNRDMAIKIIASHLAVGVVYAIAAGLWDMYFKYYLEKKRKLLERALVVKQETLERLKRSHRDEEVFNPEDAGIRAQVREAIESDSERKLLLRKLRVGEYAPRYVLMGFFWELHLVWRFLLQYLLRWVEVFTHLGQIIADKLYKKLERVGLED
jgi:hypothetical protein